MNETAIDFDKSLAFTGHRPQSLYGFDFNENNLKIIRLMKVMIERYIIKRGVTTFISGMALGVDQWAAQIVIELKKKYPNIKLVCAIPCQNHSSRWSKEQVFTYNNILKKADYVHMVSDEPYAPYLMIVRDKWMVDHAKYTFAVWNGKESGGTWKTIQYARDRQRSIVRLDTNEFKIEIDR